MLTFLSYADNRSNDSFKEELRAVHPHHQGIIINKLLRAQENGFTPKFYKQFKGYAGIVFGEFIIGDYRILNCRLNDTTYLMLRLFKKRTNETPPSEIKIALERYTNYLYNSGL